MGYAAAIWAFIAVTIAPLLIKLLVSLGLGYATYTGVTTGLEALGTWVEGQFAGLPTFMLQLMGILQMDTAISIILAAYSARIAVQVVSGSLTRMTQGAPTLS